MTASPAQLLAQARIGKQRLAELPLDGRPSTAAEAYDCQNGVVRQLLDHYQGSLIGYKIACTNVTAQQQLSVDGPFFGRLFSAFYFESPAIVDAGQFFMRVVEAEFGFHMGRDLPPQAQARDCDEVADAVDAVIPAIEIVDSRFHDWTTIGAPSLIADNACNAAWIRGALYRDWRGLDLASTPVRVTVNGKLMREGSGRNVLGHPLNALQWLVNALSERGIGLEAGQYITTGVTTEVYMAEAGESITAEFGPIGSVDLKFR